MDGFAAFDVRFHTGFGFGVVGEEFKAVGAVFGDNKIGGGGKGFWDRMGEEGEHDGGVSDVQATRIGL